MIPGGLSPAALLYMGAGPKDVLRVITTAGDSDTDVSCVAAGDLLLSSPARLTRLTNDPEVASCDNARPCPTKCPLAGTSRRSLALMPFNDLCPNALRIWLAHHGLLPTDNGGGSTSTRS